MPLVELRRSRCTCHNAKTNTDYVYDNIVLEDSESKKIVRKRKLVGKLDDNGALVPTSSVGRPRKRTNPAIFSNVPVKPAVDGDPVQTADTQQEMLLADSLDDVMDTLSEIEKSTQILSAQIKSVISNLSSVRNNLH